MFRIILKVIKEFLYILLVAVVAICISITLDRITLLEEKVHRDWAKEYLKYQNYYNNLERKI